MSMTHALSPRSLSATTVIAAALALGTTPALAQTAAPDATTAPAATASAPADATPPAAPTPQPSAAPTPDAQPQATVPAGIPPLTAAPATANPAPAAPTPQATSNPIVQAIPAGHEPPQAQPDATAATPPAHASATPRHVRATTAPIPRAIPSASPAIPPSPLRADQGSPAATPPAPAPAAAPAPHHSTDATWAIALAAAVGLTTAGTALVMGRQRRREDEDADAAPAYEPTTAMVEPAPGVAYATPFPEPAVEPVGAFQGAVAEPTIETTPVTADLENDRATEIAPARSTSPLSAPVLPAARFEMPAGPVPTGAARDALLERMVAAEPDDENPFTTHKGRLHRARLILAAREQALKDQATQPFDWRQYRPSRDLAQAEADDTLTVRDPAHA